MRKILAALGVLLLNVRFWQVISLGFLFDVCLIAKNWLAVIVVVVAAISLFEAAYFETKVRYLRQHSQTVLESRDRWRWLCDRYEEVLRRTFPEAYEKAKQDFKQKWVQ